MQMVTPSNTKIHDVELPCFRTCGAFIKWLSLRSPEEREANKKAAIQKVMATRPPTEHQLRYLKQMSYKGHRPANRLEAAQKIDALRRARGWV